MKKTGMMFIIFFFSVYSLAYAFDWKVAHDKADALSLTQAISENKASEESLESLYILGLVYLNGYQHLQAKDIFLKMLARDPNSFEAKWGVAECLRREHDYEKSVPMLEEIIKTNPSFSPAYITLAYIRYIQGKFDASIILTGKVINHQQENVDKANFLRAHGLYAAAKGMIAHYGGPLSKAINGAGVFKHLGIIQKLAPDSAVVNFGLGSYYMLIPVAFNQDLDKAKTYLEKTIAEDPLFPDPYVRLAQIYKKKGDYQKYEEYLAKALALDPKNELALDIKTGTCKFICLSPKEKKDE
jgi:tetratricopeptide (TPR) repeat protein